MNQNPSGVQILKSAPLVLTSDTDDMQPVFDFQLSSSLEIRFPSQSICDPKKNRRLNKRLDGLGC